MVSIVSSPQSAATPKANNDDGHHRTPAVPTSFVIEFVLDLEEEAPPIEGSYDWGPTPLSSLAVTSGVMSAGVEEEYRRHYTPVIVRGEDKLEGPFVVETTLVVPAPAALPSPSAPTGNRVTDGSGVTEHWREDEWCST